MKTKALKRFDIDAYGERVYRDNGTFVQADDASREIERLKRERVVVVNDFPNEGDAQYGSEKIAALLASIERLEARVRDVEAERNEVSARFKLHIEQLPTENVTLDTALLDKIEKLEAQAVAGTALVIELRQERDRLAQRVKELEIVKGA